MGNNVLIDAFENGTLNSSHLNDSPKKSHLKNLKKQVNTLLLKKNFSFISSAYKN